MRDEIYSRIVDIPEYKDFYQHMKVIFAHFGLTVRKSGIKFLNSRDWSDNSEREEYLRDLRVFLEENIR